MGLFDTSGGGEGLAAVSGGLQGLLEAYKLRLSAAQEDAKNRQSGFNAGANNQPRDNSLAMAALLQRMKSQSAQDEDRDENRRLRSMLTPDESIKLGVPYGTTRDQASKQGITAASAKTRADIQKSKELQPILDSLSSQFESIDFADDTAEAMLRSPKLLLKSKLPGTKERVFSQTADNISKLVKSMGESGALSTGDVTRMKGASVGGFYETRGSGRYKIDTLRDIAEEGGNNIRMGMTGSAIDSAPPARLTDYLNRKKAAGISQSFATERARELLAQGRLVQ